MLGDYGYRQGALGAADEVALESQEHVRVKRITHGQIRECLLLKGRSPNHAGLSNEAPLTPQAHMASQYCSPRFCTRYFCATAAPCRPRPPEKKFHIFFEAFL